MVGQLLHQCTMLSVFVSCIKASYLSMNVFPLLKNIFFPVILLLSGVQTIKNAWVFLWQPGRNRTRLFPGREWGKGSVYYWLATRLDWNHCGLDWKLRPNCGINLRSTIEYYEASCLLNRRQLCFLEHVLRQQVCHNGYAIFMHFIGLVKGTGT